MRAWVIFKESSAEAAILQLKAYKTYDQLSFHTDRVIKTLNFVESIEV